MQQQQHNIPVNLDPITVNPGDAGGADPQAGRVAAVLDTQAVALRRQPVDEAVVALGEPGLPVASLRQVAAAIAEAARSDASVPAAPPKPDNKAVAGPTRVLTVRIELADFGEVNLRLALNGNALTLAIRTEGEDAARRLRTDREALCGMLKASGYDADVAAIEARHVDPGNVARLAPGSDPSLGGQLAHGAFGQAGGERGSGHPATRLVAHDSFPPFDSNHAHEEHQDQDRRSGGLYV